jgi:aminoglycoside 3-N-acetyltransferase I
VPADEEDDHAIEFYRALGAEASPVTFFTFSRPESETDKRREA